jgi:pentatricopeptide repeat protein
MSTTDMATNLVGIRLGLAATLVSLFCVAPSPIIAAETARALYDQLVDAQSQWDSYGRQVWQTMGNTKDQDAKLSEALQLSMNKVFKLQDELEDLAKSGDADAQFWEGAWHYHMGMVEEAAFQQSPKVAGFMTDATTEYRKAATWWRPLADKGVAYAQWNFGHLFAYGRGVTKSPSNAIDWYYKALKQFVKTGNHEDALNVLDEMKVADNDNPLTKRAYKLLYPPN